MKVAVKWNQVVIALLIGFACGMLFGKWYARENFRPHWKQGGMKQHMLDKFNKELHLSADQSAQISAIFDMKHPQMVALQEEMKPKFEALRQSTHDDIRKILSSDQQSKLDQMDAKMKERWKERDKFFVS